MTTPSSRELSFLASAITRNCGISEGVSFVFLLLLLAVVVFFCFLLLFVLTVLLLSEYADMSVICACYMLIKTMLTDVLFFLSISCFVLFLSL